jgi:4-amino-4-deoxy-L-arabinose transferase-like glycosyltransferase
MAAPEDATPCVGAVGRRGHAREAVTAVLLTLFALLLYFHHLGSLSLFDADEPAFAQATREMLISGDWITPRFNGEPRFDKPILFYWMMAVAYRWFGATEFAARFWSAAFATGLVLSIYLFARVVLTPRGALAACLAFATNVATGVLARAAVTDMVLTFFMTWSLFGFFSALRGEPRPSRHFLPVAYGSMALAVLTKGPIGLLIPILVIGLYVVLRGKATETIRRLRPASGLLLFGLIALPWYLLAYRANGWAFIEGFFVKHHLVRYTGVIAGHRGPIYYFVPVVVLGFFPWSGLLPGAVRELWSARGRMRENLSPRQEVIAFAWVWFGVVFAVFSLSGTKLPSYIFPAFPALALLAGAAGGSLFDARGGAPAGGTLFDWLVSVIGGALALGCLLSPVIAEAVRIRAAPDVAPLALGASPYLLAVVFVVCPALVVWFRRIGHGHLALATLSAMMAVVFLVAVRAVAPAVQRSLQGPLLAFADEARRRLEADDLLVAYDLNAPSLVFYAVRSVVKVGKGDERRLETLAAAEGALLIVAKRSAEARLGSTEGIFLLDRRGGYSLYSNRAAR